MPKTVIRRVACGHLVDSKQSVRVVAGTLALAAVLALTSPAAADDAQPGGRSGPDDFRPREDKLAFLVDRARADAGVLPIARAAALDRAASAHADEMVADGYMDHDGPGGSTPASRAADAGYVTPAGGPWIVVEVISARGDQPEDALDWWLNDGLHRRVVLRSTWREMGIGFAAGRPYGRFWVMEFACRPDVLPPVLLDGTLSIPDENCGTAASSFGHVHDVRVAPDSASLATADWQPYTAQLAWPGAASATVEMRDGQGRDQQVAATDPGGSAVTGP